MEFGKFAAHCESDGCRPTDHFQKGVCGECALCVGCNEFEELSVDVFDLIIFAQIDCFCGKFVVLIVVKVDDSVVEAENGPSSIEESFRLEISAVGTRRSLCARHVSRE